MLALALMFYLPALPPAWHGTWAGTLHITPASGEPKTVAMRLTVKPLAGGRHTWALTYNDGDKSDERKHKLVPGNKPGQFVIDQKNGITPPNRLIGVPWCACSRSATPTWAPVITCPAMSCGSSC